MSNLLKGKTVDDAINIIKNYDNMIKEKDYDKDLIEEANAYDDIYKQPSRIKCATLSWDGVYKELLKYKEK
jgi:nitrogen fixation NifU-like protein